MAVTGRGQPRAPLPPNSPNLYPHFDAIYLYGLHLKVDTWGEEESKSVRNRKPPEN